MSAQKMKDDFIEQLRGIAILLVLIYHFVNRIPSHIMGSATPPSIEFFSGKIGVYLFFIISGFLIAKTIDTCSSAGEFYAKRVSRIWPLFIFSNILVFVWAKLFETPIVPTGIKDFDVHGRTIADLIGTSFFLEPLGFRWIDGVHWSILVELQFYAFIGFFAHLFKNRFVDVFAWFAILMATGDFLLYAFVGHGSPTPFNKLLHGVFISQYLPFFAMGILLLHRKHTLLLACCVFLCSAQLIEASSKNPDFTVEGTLRFLTLFTTFLALDKLLFQGRICLFFGTYSYSIYLFHQVIGLSIILMLTAYIGIDLAILAALAFVVALSVFASWLFEWRYRRQVTTWLMKAGSLIGLNRLAFAQNPPEHHEVSLTQCPP